MIHRLCRPPSIPLSFNLAAVLPRRPTYRVSFGTAESTSTTPSGPRLQRGLPGYLILFAPHAFTPQRQEMPSEPPSPRVFLLISTHFTATPGIPLTSAFLQPASMRSSFRVEPWRFHFTLNRPPTRSLRPVNPDNARTLRLTAAAGT